MVNLDKRPRSCAGAGRLNGYLKSIRRRDRTAASPLTQLGQTCKEPRLRIAEANG